MDVLVVLSRAAPEVVGREELLGAVWADVHVQGDVLIRAISELRRVFGDDARDPWFIETVRGRGYRLLLARKDRVAGSSPSVAADASAGSDAGGWTISGPFLRGVPVVGALLLGALLVRGLLVGGREAPSESALGHGSEIRPLASHPGRDLDPAFSESGRELLSIHVAGRESTLRRLDLSSGRSTALFTGAPGEALRSPVFVDANTIAALRGGIDPGVVELDRHSGALLRQLDVRWAGPSLDVSPEGDAYLIGRRATSQDPSTLELLPRAPRAAGTGWGDLAASPVDRFAAAFSPAGRRVAFAEKNRGRVRIGVWDLDEEEPRWIASGIDKVADLTWRDEETVVVAATRGGRFDLFAISTEGEVRVLREETEDLVGVAVSSSGDLAWVRSEEVTDLWVVDARTGRSEPWLESTRRARWPAVAAGRVVFVSDRSGEFEVWSTATVDPPSPSRRTRLGSRWTAAPALHHDGRILFESRTEVGRAIFALDAEVGTESRPRQILAGAEDRWGPAWGADGETVYFIAEHNGRPQPWRFALVPEGREGPAEPVPVLGSVERLAAVPGALLYSRADAVGLWMLDLETRQESILIPDLRPEWRMTWAVDVESVWWVDDVDDEAVLRRTLRSGGTTTIGVLPALARWTSLAPLGDGRVLWVRVARSESDIFGQLRGELEPRSGPSG